MTNELTDKWEPEMLRLMVEIYSAQFRRSARTIRTAEVREIKVALERLYRNEPAKVEAQLNHMVNAIADDVIEFTLNEHKRVEDNPVELVATANRLVTQVGRDFARTMSENSLRLMYSAIDEWRQTPNATKAGLIRTMNRIWEGPRPRAAATTETTRLIAGTRVETFKRLGFEYFITRTRNDDRVRERHDQISKNGPYHISRADMIPPFGDVGCRCNVFAYAGEN